MTMDQAEAIRRFGAAEVATLGTVTPAGSPRLVPITFALDGELLVTAVDHKPKSTLRLARLSDIEATGVASVLVHHYETEWSQLWWIRADGMARVEDGPAPSALIDKYPAYRTQPPRGPLIVMRSLHWRWWSAAGDTD